MCFMVIGHLLGPSVDDASAAEVGDLAVSIIEKAGAGALGNSMHELIQVIAVRLASAKHPTLIQSLIMVFARLILLNAAETVNFLAGIQIENSNALAVVLTKWLENATTFAGFDAIRESVTALATIYNLHDPRLRQITVQGDLVVDTSSRIKTRSMAKNAPIQYTAVSADLKLVKVLVNELVPYTDHSFGASVKSPTTPSFPGGAPLTRTRSEDSWESEPDDSGLMARMSDDETQKYLVDFFRQQGAQPVFQELYGKLSAEEKKRCVEAVESYGAMEAQRAQLGQQ
jgi:hypothetical protein